MVFRDQEYNIHGELDMESQSGPFHQHAITLVSKGPDSAQISPAQINADGPMSDAMMPHGVRFHRFLQDGAIAQRSEVQDPT